ncbi:substrate-binding periplasmic protein [Tepidimonas sp. HKU78]|uniref:substrate-binding periplasmic protein n=1 Tax=Tepidimonas sp. HKU78 TaxID=3414504 RepID=UPI003CF32ECD
MPPRPDNLKTSDRLRRRCLAAVSLLPLMPFAPTLQAQELTDLARVRANGVLKVAVYKDNPPFSSGPAGAMTGLDVSLAQALARQLGVSLSLLPFDAGENMNDDLRNMVWRGHYLGYGPADVMLQVPVDRFLMNENPQVLIFAPYMRQVPVLLFDTHWLAGIRGPEDLKGLPVAVERGTAQASLLMGYRGGMLRDQVSIQISGPAAAQQVVEGKAAAAYITRAQAESVLATLNPRPAHFQLTELVLGNILDRGWPVGMAIKASHKELGQALEAAMQQLRSSGELLAIFRQHGLTLTAP